MYRGSNITARQSQCQIADAMMALLGEKPFSQITVSALCKAAGVSRQTFYSLFASREDVIAFGLRFRDCGGPRLGDSRPSAGPDDPLRWLCRCFSEYILRHRRLIKLLVDNNIDYLLYNGFHEAWEGCGCFLRDADPCARGYAAAFYAGGIAGVARRFAREGCVRSAEQLESLLESLLCGRLF